MRRLTHLLVLCAFVFSCGGHWYFLQGIAWANMIREYSRMVPLTQAIQMTFSGRYPCPLCKAIAEKKQEENSRLATIAKQEKKIVSSGLIVAACFTTVSPQTFFIPESFFQTRADAPPTPPPRFA